MDTPLFDETFRALHPRERRRHRWDGAAHPLPVRPGSPSRHGLDSRTEEIRLPQAPLEDLHVYEIGRAHV